jgi:hypothetical protein
MIGGGILAQRASSLSAERFSITTIDQPAAAVGGLALERKAARILCARGGESRYILGVSEARPQKETKGVEHAREYRN